MNTKKETYEGLMTRRTIIASQLPLAASTAKIEVKTSSNEWEDVEETMQTSISSETVWPSEPTGGI